MLNGIGRTKVSSKHGVQFFIENYANFLAGQLFWCKTVENSGSFVLHLDAFD